MKAIHNYPSFQKITCTLIATLLTACASTDRDINLTSELNITPQALQITATLKNPRPTAAHLIASTPCAILKWHITDHASNTILKKPNRLCIQIVAEQTLPAGQTITRQLTIPLNQPPGTYHLHLKFWGYPTAATFIIKK